MAFWRWAARFIGVLPSDRGVAWSPIPDEEWPEWRRRWQAMPHRRLDGPARFDFGVDPGVWDKPVAATIALAPPEHAHRLIVDASTCPICGLRVVEPDRRPAYLSSIGSNGRSLGFGAWVHPACFDGLPDAGTPAPVPW